MRIGDNPTSNKKLEVNSQHYIELLYLFIYLNLKGILRID
jgi:hypothetical protein